LIYIWAKCIENPDRKEAIRFKFNLNRIPYGGLHIHTLSAPQKISAIQKLDSIIDKNKHRLVESVREMIRVRSVRGYPEPGSPFGQGPAKALSKALEIAKSLGFETVNMDGYIGYAEYGSGRDYIAILCHVDTVPEGDGWNYPPFCAPVHEGKIFGRGATDDKGPAIAALYALDAIKKSELTLSKRVRVIFGTDEETDNADIIYYLKKEKAPEAGFTPDALYPLVYAEKGIIDFDLVKDTVLELSSTKMNDIRGGTAINMVPDLAVAEIEAEDIEALIKECHEFAKKTGFDLNAMKKNKKAIIESIGIAAHGSVPEDGKNAIMQLFAFLGMLNLGSSAIEQAVFFLNSSIGMETNGKSLGLALEDKPSGKLSLNLGMVKMTRDKLTCSFDIRYPVTYDIEDVMLILNQRIAQSGFRLENLRHQKPLYLPIDSPLVNKLLSIFKEQTGYQGAPLAIGGGTYAKEMPNILAFGPIFPGKPIVEHKPNEYIQIDELILNCKIYAHAIYELAK
jgi:succinyl-diaminopimelate desuccinylase